jgi:hypothetical protein
MLEQRVALQHRLAEQADRKKRNLSSRLFLKGARENASHASVIRKMLGKP